MVKAMIAQTMVKGRASNIPTNFIKIFISSYHEDDELTEDDEDENEHVLPHTENGRSGLEWDDSTLASVSRTYRV